MRASLGRLLMALALAAGAACAQGQSLESAVMPGKVIEGHAKLEADCGNCHKRFDRAAQAALCAACHKDVGADVTSHRGFHGRQREPQCRACHTDHKGRQARIVQLDEGAFDHGQADFALGGAHLKLECRSCHRPGAKHRDAASDCVACHRKDDKHKGSLGRDCGSCHVDGAWKTVRFDHDKTKFPLRGSHIAPPCEACHKSERFADTSRECVACHRKDDVHKGRFGARCESCHDDRKWKPAARFDHDRDTRYPLRAKHRTLKCETCHRGLLFQEKLQTACLACHRRDDVHRGALGVRCESCHSERGWKTTSFDHDKTKFPLKSRHRETKCADCHKDPGFKDKPPLACYGCHRKDDDRKGHHGRYGEKCETCHAENAWKPSRFDHARDTRYTLRGAHQKVSCDSCHRGRLYEDRLSQQCNTCHQKDDKHRGQLGARCDGCHVERSWKDTRFDHNRTAFPLVGRHARVECRACHASLAFKDAPSACNGCHEKNDVHKRRLGTLCADCHNARDWRIWDFDHDQRTRFRLAGAHRRLECLSCHRAPMTGKVVVRDSTCRSCHERDDVHHGQFGAQCDRCHVDTNWRSLKQRLSRNEGDPS
jgi:hypothetical protein